MDIHGPSIGIGAAAASAVIVLAFFAFSGQPETELQFANDPPKADAVTLSVLTGNGSPVLGSPDAPVTLVEFGDYQCFFCNKFFHGTEKELLADYVSTGKVKLIFKDNVIIGPDSEAAARGAHCAEDQGFFWEYHDVLYENWDGENNGWASMENLASFAGEIGLDEEQWGMCMSRGDHGQLVAASRGDAEALGLDGTPIFFVIGPDNAVTKIGGAQPYEVFQRIFESELAK